MKRLSLKTTTGDMWGGLSAAVITLPMSIAYGIAAFSALGPEFRPHAALLGLNGAVFGGLIAALLGGTPTQITGPKAPLTLIMTTVVAGLAADPILQGVSPDNVWVIVGLTSVCVFIGGVTQVIFGLVGLGNVVKYIPYPVVSGFMNGIAMLLIWNQLPPFLGLDRGSSLLPGLIHFSTTQGVTLFIGVVTLASIYLSRMLFRRIPSFLTGLIVGTGLFFILSSVFGGASGVAAIGDLHGILPLPTAFAGLAGMPGDLFSSARLMLILLYGVILGIIGSMESLMSAVAIDNVRGSRHDSKHELIGQGIGNLVAACFGTLYVAGSIPRSLANVRAGGRNKTSGAWCSLMMLGLFLTLAPLIGRIPLSVFAAIIISVGIGLFDRSTLRLIRALNTPGKVRRDVSAILLVNGGVAVITVSVDLISAVIIGLAISTAYFIVKMGTSVIRREYTAELICSNKVRDCRQIDFLNANRHAIKVFELQGPIFFGSADRLAQIIDARTTDVTYCILDMKRVSEIDSTGANILVRLYKGLHQQGKLLLVSHLDSSHALWDFLNISGVQQAFAADRFFANTDLALEWAEDQLLAEGCPMDTCRRLGFDELDLLNGFSADEIAMMADRLEPVRLKHGDLLIREGATDRDLYVLVRGSVSVTIRLPFSDGHKRLFTFGAGAVVGEMALLDGKPRSANVQADEDAELYRLPWEGFDRLLGDHPRVAAKLLKNIGLVLSHRLRARSDELRMTVD